MEDKVKKTRHTLECSPPGRGPGFRRTPGCPRCEELIAGEAPREATGSVRWMLDRKANDERRAAEIREHFAPGGPHSLKACGPVCTFGDW